MPAISSRTVAAFLKDLKNQWLVGAVIFFLISLAMGGVKGGDYPFVYTGLWLIFGLLFLFSVYKAFRNAWHLILPIGFIYVFSFFGVISFVRVENQGDWRWALLGLISEGVCLAAVIVILFSVVNKRDEMMEVSRHRKEFSKKTDIDLYLPLGWWSLSLVFILFMSNISIWYWSDYQLLGSKKSFFGYFISEIFLLGLLLYFFWIPERNLDFSTDKDLVTDVKRNPFLEFLDRFSITRKRTPLTRRSLAKKVRRKQIRCPDCKRLLKIEKRKCPNCSKIKRFGWCPRSEDFIVNCPKCRKLVSISGGNCKKCGESISSNIRCSCGNIANIENWELVL